MTIQALSTEIQAARAYADTLPEGSAYDAAMAVEARLLGRLVELRPRTVVELAEKARLALRYGPDDALNAAVIRDVAQLAA